MCEFFVTADPVLHESRTRSVRIHGVHISIRLESFVWDTLAVFAADENMTINALIVQFRDEILHHRSDVQNFTSFPRMTCLRYLCRKCDQLEAARQTEGVMQAQMTPQKRTLQTTH